MLPVMDAADLARIRFVTSRFHELQGLRHLVVLPCCMVAFWSRPFVDWLHDSSPALALAGFVFSVAPWLLVLAARPVLNRYYGARFGSVGTGPVWSPDMIGWMVLTLGGFSIDMSTFGAAKPSAVLVAGSLIALHVVWRDWPWRTHHLGVAIACAGGAWLTAANPAFRVDNLDDLLRIPFTIFMCAHGVGAWLDHRLLLRTLPPHPGTSAEALSADHADPV
jgi:hypothetical protein